MPTAIPAKKTQPWVARPTTHDDSDSGKKRASECKHVGHIIRRHKYIPWGYTKQYHGEAGNPAIIQLKQ